MYNLLTCTNFKHSTIIPVPKKPYNLKFNGYNPVALMSVAMKSFKILVLSHLKVITVHHHCWTPCTPAVCWGTGDAFILGLHLIPHHHDSSGTYTWILFVEFNSAIDVIIPMLLYLSVDHQLPDWQEAAGKAGEHHIQHLDYQHRWPPGVCPLSTNVCTSGDPSVKLLKFADSHHCHLPHPGQWWGCMQMWGGTAGPLVWS